MAYHRIHGINTKIVRIFNTYGERMRINDGRVVPNLIHQALHNKPLTVYGKGKQTRSFCYIDDLVEGIFRLMQVETNDPVNLGNPNEFTILQLMRLVVKLTETRSRVVFKELPQDDPRQRQPDISRANKILRWKPEVELKEGLSRTIEWFRKKG
jgi:dTDP-glucose 4,6-dehydratase